jgi:hypothetical protein
VLAGFASGSVFAVFCGGEAASSAVLIFTPPAELGAAEGVPVGEVTLDTLAALNPGDGGRT